MILITSAAYVDPEFRIEFGLLPPSFLPVGNKRLFEHQINVLSERFLGEQIYISLPSSYVVSPKDLIYLTLHEIEIIQIDEGLPLSASIAIAIKKMKIKKEPLRILHGDTLLGDFPRGFDVLAVARTQEDYQWEVEETHAEYESVWCGYFSVSDCQKLLGLLESSGCSFSEAIKAYDLSTPLERYFASSWSDFGHINTYFLSRSNMTTERSFNSLIIEDGFVYKTGEIESKISAEAAWYKNLPKSLRGFSPQLIDSSLDGPKKPYYILEYLALPPLNEVYVHGRNPVFYWGKIFRLCANFLNACEAIKLSPEQVSQINLSSKEMARIKNISRIETFISEVEGIEWDAPLFINSLAVPSLREMLQNCLDLSKSVPIIPGAFHGDFCLSNILFDSRLDRIKVIDPRGLDAFGKESNYGDLTYDLAKLTHSIIGLYDFIIAGAFKLEVKLDGLALEFKLDIYIDKRISEIQELFLAGQYLGIKPLEVMPSVVLLFLSMLPLHYENRERQLALLANALRLYSTYIMDAKE